MWTEQKSQVCVCKKIENVKFYESINQRVPNILRIYNGHTIKLRGAYFIANSNLFLKSISDLT